MKAITAKEAATILGNDQTYVYSLIRRGKLEEVPQDSGPMKVSEESVLRYKEEMSRVRGAVSDAVERVKEAPTVMSKIETSEAPKIETREVEVPVQATDPIEAPVAISTLPKSDDPYSAISDLVRGLVEEETKRRTQEFSRAIETAEWALSEAIAQLKNLKASLDA